MKAAIITFLLKNFGEVGKILAVLFKEVVQKELAIVLPIALEVIKLIQADPSVVTSKGKASTAFGLIGDKLVEQHKEVATSTINLAIELAVKAITVK
jgi:hypothetical protein